MHCQISNFEIEIVVKLGVDLHKRPTKLQFSKGIVHILCCQEFGFFEHLPPSINIFYDMNIDKKWTFLDYLPTYLVL